MSRHFQQSCLPSAIPWVVPLILGSFLLSALPADASRVPAGKTYFTVIVGLFTEHEVDVACVRFTGRRICFEGGPCGTWERMPSEPGLSTLVWEATYPAGHQNVHISGELNLNERGRGSALGGAGQMEYDGAEVNFSLAGRSVSRRQCRRLAADFERTVINFGNSQCLQRAQFGTPSSSAYILPYDVGSSYNVSQSYCDPHGGSHRSKFAYDFDMPIGMPVLAARDGEVWMVLDEFEDGDRVDSHENVIRIEHADGSVALYAHIGFHSALVAPGDRVVAGQVIATSSDTGTAIPHLHFQVQDSRDVWEDHSLPINFRNAEGPLDERGGLMLGVSYRALAW